MKSISAMKKNVSGLLSVLLTLSLCLLPVQAVALATASEPLQESFETYGSAQSGYELPVGSTGTALQPWKAAIGGTVNWAVYEETSTPGAAPNHFLRQTDPSTASSYVVTNEFWGNSNPAITTNSITLSGKAKITGPNSTYAGLVAKYSGSGSTRAYYRFMMKKNTLSYQFYLEKVTGNTRAAVTQTPGTPNASGISIPNETLASSYDALGYMPLKLNVIKNTDSTLTLEGYYGSTLVLSGTDAVPLNTGHVGLYSNAGTTAFDDIAVSAYTAVVPTIPDAPTDVAATLPGTGAVKLTWTPSANATSYNVKMASSAEGPFSTINGTPVISASYTASNLNVGQTYYFVVSAVNAAGESSNSSPALSAIPQPNPPFTVTNSTQLVQALKAAAPGDVIELENGSYAGFGVTGVNGSPDKPIVIRAKNKGLAVFNSTGIRFTNSSYITMQDFEFSMSSAASNWVRLTGSNHMRVTNNYFHSQDTATSATKSTWVLIDGRNSHQNRIDHNLMENKKDTGKFITLDGFRDTVAGIYEITQNDMVEYNIFRNTLPRQENESEGIRLGVSDLVHLNAYTVIQYNIFDHVDSDPEFVSVKSSANTIRYNYFIESLGTVALRSGNGSSVYGNMFIGNGRNEPATDPDGRDLGTGGVRVYGENHKIYNNYFQDLAGTVWDAAITFTTGDNDNMTQPISRTANHYIAKNALIANNTLINNKGSIELGMTRYGRAPENLTFINNIVVSGQQELIKIMTPIPGLVWSGNQMFPQSGIPLVSGNSAPLSESEVRVAYPQMRDEVLELDRNEYAWLWTSSEYERLRTIKYKKLTQISPAIEASLDNGGSLSLITEDVEHEPRVGIPDAGADEFTPNQLTDVTAPNWNSAQPLTIAGVAPRQAQLQWTAASDDTYIVAYNIYRGGVLHDIAFGDVLSYSAISLEPGETHTFKVEAVDQANRKVASNTISVTTPAFTGISVSGVPSDMALGGTAKQLAVTAHFEDTSTEDVTASSSFASSNPNAVTVSESGKITATGLGDSSVTATFNGTTSQPLTLTVFPSLQTTKLVDADTYVDNITSTNADTNYNNASVMSIRTASGKQSGYLKTTVPDIADTVDTIQLKLYVGDVDNGSDLVLRGIVDDTWDAATITANNQPARSFSDVDLGKIASLKDNSYVTFDITKFYQAQHDKLLSFRLTMESSSNTAPVSTLEGSDIQQAPTLIITTIDRSTTLNVHSTTGVYSDTTELKAVLKNSADQPAIGETIAFKVNGVEAGIAVTDLTGTATLPYQVKGTTDPESSNAVHSEQSSPQLVIEASFAGNAAVGLKASQSTGVLTVLKEEAGITYSGTLSAVDQVPVTIAASVSQQQDGELGDVGNLPVKFVLYKMDASGLFVEYPTSVSQSVYATDPSGSARVPVTLAAGIYQVKSSLAANVRFQTADAVAIITVNGSSVVKAEVKGTMDVNESPNPIFGGNAEKLHLDGEWSFNSSASGLSGQIELKATPQGIRLKSDSGGFAVSVDDGTMSMQGTVRDENGILYTIRLIGRDTQKPQATITLLIWNGTDTSVAPALQTINQEFNGSIKLKKN
ncbi:MAG: hypothetical protein K0Q73_97 [Paenibacillus sp.]|nr:hypothetical protein [Paenibacillus sp.]